MRDASGRVVVMDFGLARTMQSDGMTQTGLMIGTMEYMSPEQAMGVELDARSDLFALGLIFYEALSGDIPFRADSAIASLVKRTVESAKPLRDRDATIPEGLSSIVSKCLEREPAQRYASANQIIEDLHAWRGNGPLTHVGIDPGAPWRFARRRHDGGAWIFGYTSAASQNQDVSVEMGDCRYYGRGAGGRRNLC